MQLFYFFLYSESDKSIELSHLEPDWREDLEQSALAKSTLTLEESKEGMIIKINLTEYSQLLVSLVYNL